MIESLATIMNTFSGEANRARCLAHIVNLVAKIILRQFDMSKKKKKKQNLPENLPEPPNDAGDNVVVVENDGKEPEEDADDFDEEKDRVLDKEEKEMDDGDDEDDEDSEKLARDAELIEEAMEDDIERAVRKAKPVRQALFKASPIFFFFYLSSIFYRSFPFLFLLYF